MEIEGKRNGTKWKQKILRKISTNTQFPCLMHIWSALSSVFLSPLVIFLDSFSGIVIFSSFSSSRPLKCNISRWIFMIKWMASWKLCKNHKVNELKMFHDVYDDYILVKGTLLSLSFPFLENFKLFLHISHFHHSHSTEIEY